MVGVDSGVDLVSDLVFFRLGRRLEFEEVMECVSCWESVSV